MTQYSSAKQKGITHFVMRQPRKVKLGAVLGVAVGFLVALSQIQPWLTPYVTNPAQTASLKVELDTVKANIQTWQVTRAARDAKEDDFQAQVLASLTRNESALQVIQSALSRNRISGLPPPDWLNLSVGTLAAAKPVN